MSRRPSRSTLLPCSTLFSTKDESRILSWSEDGTLRLWNAGWPKGNIVKVACALLPDTSLEQVSELDRKSTRLNSSHANISYAVFCLKKKNNYPTTHHNTHLS